LVVFSKLKQLVGCSIPRNASFEGHI